MCTQRKQGLGEQVAHLEIKAALMRIEERLDEIEELIEAYTDLVACNCDNEEEDLETGCDEDHHCNCD